MVIFRFGQIRKKFLYPLIMCFFYFWEQLFFLCYIKEVKKKDKTVEFSPIFHPYILVWLRFLVQMFGIIPLLMESSLSKSEKIKHLFMLQNIKNDSSFSGNSWKTLLILICLSLTESTTNAFGIIFDNFPYSLFKICSQTLLIIFTSFICVKFLKYEYFKHHNLSIAVIFCASILYAIADTLQDNGLLKSNSFVYIIEVLLVLIMRGTQECVEKWLMDKKFLSPYFIMFVEGLSGFIITSLSFIMYAKSPCVPKEKVYHCEWDIVEDFFKTMKIILSSSWYVTFLILYMISNYFFVIFKLLTNKSLSPSHRSISDILGLFVIWVLRVLWLEEAFQLKQITAHTGNEDDNDEENQKKIKLPDFAVNIIKLLSYIGMIFAMLVFLEIIIIPYCNLDANTDDEIDSRSNQERLSLHNLLELENKRKLNEEGKHHTDEPDIPPTDI